MHTHQNSSDAVATIGVDIGKNTFHLVGLDRRGAIVLRTKVSRSQLERRLANVPSCLVGLEAVRSKAICCLCIACARALLASARL